MCLTFPLFQFSIVMVRYAIWSETLFWLVEKKALRLMCFHIFSKCHEVQRILIFFFFLRKKMMFIVITFLIFYTLVFYKLTRILFSYRRVNLFIGSLMRKKVFQFLSCSFFVIIFGSFFYIAFYLSFEIFQFLISFKLLLQKNSQLNFAHSV